MDTPRQENDVPLLQPDHPLMEIFQNSLKQHLTNTNQQLFIHSSLIKSKLKQLKKTYEDEIEENVYKTERQVDAQRKIIKIYEDNFYEVVDFRKQSACLIKTKRNSLHAQNQKNEQSKNKHSELIQELEALQQIYKHFTTLKNETESELLINQGISIKISEEKYKISMERKKLDTLIYQLSREIWNIQSRISNIDNQLHVKSQQFGIITKKNMSFRMDLEVLNREQRRLIEIWGSIIANIQQKDKTNSSLSIKYEEIQSSILDIKNQAELLKKNIYYETQIAENRSNIKNEIQYNLSKSIRTIGNLENKLYTMNDLKTDLMKILEATEKEENHLNIQNKINENNFKIIHLKSQKLITEKIDDENRTLDLLQERLTTDKNIDSIAGSLKKLKNTSRIKELNSLESQNKLMKYSLEIEKWKSINSELRNNQLIARDKYHNELSQNMLLEKKKNYNSLSIQRNQTIVDNIKKKIKILVDTMEGEEVSPQEKLIMALENVIAENLSKHDKIKKIWIENQNKMLHLMEQLQKQNQFIDILLKQKELCEYKSDKIQNDIFRLKENESQMKFKLEKVQARLEVLEKKKFYSQTSNENLRIQLDNLIMTNLSKLKETEEKMFDIQDAINELEKSKESLAENINQLKKQCNLFNNKITMVTETKDQIYEQSKYSGDIQQMKNEIHRMQVRYEQLCKHSKILAKELAATVNKRDSAFYHSISHHQQCPKTIKKSHYKTNLQKLKQILKQKTSELQILKLTHNQINEDLEENKNTLYKLEKEISTFYEQVEYAQLRKQMNREIIFRCQEIIKNHEAAIKGKTKQIKIKNPSTNSSIIRELYSKNIKLLNNLLCKLPEKRVELQKIINILLSSKL